MSGVRRGLVELLMVAALYVAYTFSRMLADTDVGAALGRARELLRVEDAVGLAREQAVNAWFVAHDTVGVIASFWYSSAHYVVTVVALVWLYRRGRDVYVPARRALAAATVLGLVFYLLLPTAPPRMIGGYVDVLRLHADVGWWGADASAPKGLGGLTNELAAFPSLHAGWSLWVAFAVMSATRNRVLRVAGWTYAAVTAVVVVGTANHWTVDVIVGWIVAAAGWLLADALGRLADRRRGELVPAPARVGTAAATAGRTAIDRAVSGTELVARAVREGALTLPGMTVPPAVVRRLAHPPVPDPPVPSGRSAG
ncbi:phosphatase PAP2 family protein [Nocardioides sp. KR10-350]|uniref:phosphatase PAP2 family protein n=1 Tax=Nocardioides cheoyonin TaxID=3156615 RepID=UPI0032B3DBB8